MEHKIQLKNQLVIPENISKLDIKWEKKIVLAIVYQAIEEYGFCTFSNKAFALYIHSSERSVSRYLTAFELDGYIKTIGTCHNRGICWGENYTKIKGGI